MLFILNFIFFLSVDATARKRHATFFILSNVDHRVRPGTLAKPTVFIDKRVPSGLFDFWIQFHHSLFSFSVSWISAAPIKRRSVNAFVALGGITAVVAIHEKASGQGAVGVAVLVTLFFLFFVNASLMLGV